MCTFSSCANIVQAQEVGRASSYTAATSNLLIVVVWNLVVIAKRLLVILGNRFNFFNLFIVDGNIFIHQPPHHWKQLCLQEPPCCRWKRLCLLRTPCYCWKPHRKHRPLVVAGKLIVSTCGLGGWQHCSCQVLYHQSVVDVDVQDRVMLCIVDCKLGTVTGAKKVS